VKIFLTGVSGQVGTEFQRRSSGLEVVAPHESVFDLTKAETIAPTLDAANPGLILNVAAYTAVDRAEDDAERAHAINARAVEAIAEWAAPRDVPLVQISTDYVFDGSAGRPYREDDTPAPGAVYGRTKLAGENAARTVPRHLVLRTSWVFSAHGANFVLTMLRLGAERDRLRVVDDQRGGPTWAGHLAESLVTLSRRIVAGETLPWGTFHYSGQPHTTWCAFARATLEQAHVRGLIAKLPAVEAIATHEYPTRAQRPVDSRLDGTRAARELGLAPPDWRDGLTQVVDELAQHRAG
jgi:dTDP-4-dehydrorhamnose reductase